MTHCEHDAPVRRHGVRTACFTVGAVVTVVALMGTGLVARATAAAAAPTRTVLVDPVDRLVDGQTVSISGSGWIPGRSVTLCEGGNEGSGIDSFGCANGSHVMAMVDSAGNFSGSIVITRETFVPSLSSTIDCADLSFSCWAGAAYTSDLVGSLIADMIFFGGLCPALVAAPHTSFFLSNGVVVASVATFLPDEGYVLAGASTLTCEPSLAWSGPPPTALFTGTPAVVPGVAAVAEGNSGTTALKVPVTLSDASTRTVTVRWNTLFVAGRSDNQADPATDYTSASGTVSFAPGETAKTVGISVKGDTRVEPDEYVVVSFHDAVNATVGGFYGLGLGTITNDDLPRPAGSSAPLR